MSQARVVIVGAGFGGLSAAKGLSKTKAQVTLIDKQNHHLFQPLLYQVATAGLSPGEIAIPIRYVLRHQPNVNVLMTEVTGLDPQTQTISTESGILSYDYLVLATGAHYNYFGHPDWAKKAKSLKTIADAIAIRREILHAFEAAEMEEDETRRKALMTFILVGGGPTGVEMAGALAELSHKALCRDFRRINPKSAKILLLEAGPRILSSFPESLSQKAFRSLTALGVEVRTHSPVESIEDDGVIVKGSFIAAHTTLWTAGVLASPVGKWLNVPTDRIGRTLVDASLCVPPFSNIYVIGDTACVNDEKGQPLPGVAPVAMQQGKYVAKHLRAQIEERPLPSGFVYKNKGNLATIGRSSAIADLGGLRLSGFAGWCLWLVVHIFYLIGFRNRLLVLVQWAWSYFTFQRGTRLITLPRKLGS